MFKTSIRKLWGVVEKRNVFYKYVDERVVAILKEQRLKLPRVAELNDPFDCWPNFHLTENEQELKRSFSENVRRQGVFKPEDFKQAFELAWRKPNDGAMFRLSEIRAGLIVDCQKEYAKFNQNVSLICVSKSKDNVLMWSHYADKHKGAVIEIDFGRIVTQSAFTGITLHPVQYCSRRPKIDLHLLDLNRKKYFNQIKQTPLRKAKFWEYEEEFRSAVRLDDPETIKALNLYEEPTTQRIYMPLNPSSILRIYLGYKSSEGLMAEIIEILQNPLLKHVALYKARVDAQKYRITFDPIFKKDVADRESSGSYSTGAPGTGIEINDGHAGAMHA